MPVFPFKTERYECDEKGIISLGEALIDFIPADSENLVYQKSPGGAPANVAVGLARLGAPSSFLGKVGDDVLGTFLKDTLRSYGVNTDHMLLTKEAKTGRSSSRSQKMASGPSTFTSIRAQTVFCMKRIWMCPCLKKRKSFITDPFL